MRVSSCADCGREVMHGRAGHNRQIAGCCTTCYARRWRAAHPKPPRKSRAKPPAEHKVHVVRTGSCQRCTALMVYSNTRRPGYRRHGGHDLCEACSVRARAQGSQRRYKPGRPVKDVPLEVDPVMVERVAYGCDFEAKANILERQAAVEFLSARGYSSAFIARRLGVVCRTVLRYRAAVRTTPREEIAA